MYYQKSYDKNKWRNVKYLYCFSDVIIKICRQKLILHILFAVLDQVDIISINHDLFLLYRNN